MRRILLPIILALASCATDSTPALQSLYDNIVRTRAANQFQLAIEQADRGLTLAKNRAREDWYWKFYLQKAELVMSRDGAKLALPLFDPELPPGATFDELRARRKMDQGWALLQLGEYASAKTRLEEAYRFAQSAHSPYFLGYTDFSQAELLTRMGDPAAAEEKIRDGNRWAAQQRDRRMQAFGLHSLGMLMINQSRFEDAIPVFEQTLKVAGNADNGGVTAFALNNLGWCRYRLGEFDQALPLITQAEAAGHRTGDRRLQQVALGQIGTIYLDRRDYANARVYFERALALSTDLRDDFLSQKWLWNLARVAIETKDWAGGARYNQRCVALAGKLNDKPGGLSAQVNSARVEEGKGNHAEAEQLYRQVIDAESKDPTPRLDAYIGLANLYADTGRDKQAEATFGAALLVVDQTRSQLLLDENKLSFLASMMDVHRDYVDFLMSRGKTERALEVAEANRARLLRERLGASAPRGTITAADYRSIAQRSHAVILSYWLGVKRSFVWAITPERIVAQTLPAESEITALVDRYRSLLENLHDPLRTDDPSGTTLSHMLLAPVRDLIPPGSRIILVPDGSLHALNFEALPAGGPNPHYYIEDATISVAYSLNLLARAPASRPPPRSLLVIGDPDTDDDQFPRLPFAGMEMDSLRARFHGAKVTSFRGREATPAAYLSRAGEYAYIHFAAHASANHENPLDSVIVLSGPRGANRLTAKEVVRQPVQAELVTISACRSAGAKTYSGEGLVGFTWAFFQAGAKNVIAGLWDVSDESTARLMDQLYRQLASGADPAESLRQAKLSVLRSDAAFRRPYFWAPFQLYSHEIR
jgi:CHAT domain-containing protein/Tfp pilus assembly protein PilF